MNEGLLISLVQQYPHLYDKRKKQFKNVQVRENSWNQIAAVMGETAEDCQRIFKNIRDRYGRERKKRQKVATGTESQVEEQTWALYDALSFLDEHVKPRKTSSNLRNNKRPLEYSRPSSQESSGQDADTETFLEDRSEVCEPDPEEMSITEDEDTASLQREPTPTASASSTTIHTTPTAPTINRKRRNSDKTTLEENLGPMAQTLSSFLAGQSQVDSDQAFAQYVATTLKEQDKRTKNKMKLEIMEVLSKYE